MKRTLLLLLCLLSVCLANSQKEADNWYFGWNAGVNFGNGAPVALYGGALNTDEGCATISDINGNLLFYTDGITIWNRNHNPMPNGSGLNGDPSSTQSAIIVPKSDEPNIFYVFSVDDVGGPNGVQYSIIDMNLDGGLGDITAQKAVPLITPVSEKITAVGHANGSAIWIITKSFGGNTYYSFLLDAAGLNTVPITSNAGAMLLQNDSESRGYMKASSDGSFLATAVHEKGIVEIVRFNTTTGLVSNPISLQPFLSANWYDINTYGVEFSPNNKVLYVSTVGGILQFDISNYNQAAILASGIRISPLNSSPPFLGALQMGPDGKIYCTRAYRGYLNAINSPNTLGMGCDYQEQVIQLGPTNIRGTLGLPPFVTSFFYVGIEATNFCLGMGTDFSVNVADPITSINWDFGDGNTSILETPTHTYATPGTYTVSVTVSTAIETKTETKDITIYQTPTANPITDYEVCSTLPNYEFNLATKDSEVMGAQLASEYSVQYFTSLSDAQNNTNVLPVMYTNTTATETIYSRISNSSNTACYDITNFDLIVREQPVVSSVEDWKECGSYQFLSFNLPDKDAEILNGQDDTLFSVAYFRTQADADINSSAIGPNYTLGAAQEIIYYRIENQGASSCFVTGSFNLIATPEPAGLEQPYIEVCDDDGVLDGFYTVNLLSIYDYDNVSGNGFEVNISFHENLTDAENRTNAVNATAYSNSTAYYQELWIRVENKDNQDCYFLEDWSVTVFDTPLATAVTNWQICDDDIDGQFLFDLSEKDAEIYNGQSTSDYTLSYHSSLADAELNQNSLNNLYQYTAGPQEIFYRLQSTYSPLCFVSGSFTLEVFSSVTAGSLTDFVVCDQEETGVQIFDLGIKDSEALNGQDANVFIVSYHRSQGDAEAGINEIPKQNYRNSAAEETLFVRIQHFQNAHCYTTTSFTITVNPRPQPQLEDTYVICPDSPELTIDGGNFDSWSWRNAAGTEVGSGSSIDLVDLGDYTLTVGQLQNGVLCEKMVAFEVVSSGAPETVMVNTSGFSDQISLIVNATGIGTFEYSIDGVNFQSSNQFNVFPGEYTVYVRDPFLCRTITEEIFVIGYQKFFTPNGDGTNEVWMVIGADKYPNSTLSIYDRYGKLLSQMPATATGWDGTYLGQPLPASDYWFRYDYEDGKSITGHFALKR